MTACNHSLDGSQNKEKWASNCKTTKQILAEGSTISVDNVVGCVGIEALSVWRG
ncbi:MAG TPA: hypothetical protein VES38_09555 [Methylotenera sp.]|nr:hypothetical protein [Methylotenera sp.]